MAAFIAAGRGGGVGADLFSGGDEGVKAGEVGVEESSIPVIYDGDVSLRGG